MNSKDDHSMSAGFSILLKRYRREVRGWTQKELAHKSGLKIRTIQDLETAQKSKLDHEVIAKLAEAFELHGNAKEEFFGAAGLSVISPSSEEIEWQRFIYEFYKSIDFPAFVTDDLTDVHSLNSYVMELLEVNLDTVSEAIRSSGSFNAIRFFLDPAFNSRKLYGGQWKSYTTTNVWFFRNLSRPYVHTARYQKLLTEFQKLEGFEEIWATTKDMPMPLPPYQGVANN